MGHFVLMGVACFGMLLANSHQAAGEARPSQSTDLPLSSIQQIRTLTTQQAKSGLPVKVRATVTFSIPSIATLFIHDGSAGIFVEQLPGPDALGPQPGDQVEVTGITGEGMFSTVIKGQATPNAQIVVLAHGPLPEPRRIDGHELSRPQEDSDWVAVEARVTEVLMKEGDVILACQADTCDFYVLLEGPLPPESIPWNLTETRVRICGVVATTFNVGRQMTDRFLRVNALADIEPLDLGHHPTGEARLVRADELLRVDGPEPDELVRIRGVTTLALPGRGLFLQVEGGGLWVQTAQPVAATNGTLIEVVGWPRAGAMKPFIRARSAAILGVTTSAPALPLQAREALQSHHDAELVRVDAELLNSLHGPEGTTLELRDEDMVFRGLVPDDPKAAMRTLEPGSRLRVTGVARITPTGNFVLRVEDKLQVLARSAADVQVLAPPPMWTARNVMIGAAAIIAGLLSYYQILRNRRKRAQTGQRREFEAVLAERGRFAREIHDSLAQGLTSISLQLECVRDQLTADPVTAGVHVENARGFVRDSLREARRTVWNLRPLALGESDLITALQRFACNLSAGGKITCNQQIEGTPRPLPPTHEDALLRIGQEALTNAARHAVATEISQRLRFGPGWVTLTVNDNGQGFDVASRVGKGSGLTSMQERVAALGGSLSIDSRADHGTEVSATLPT